MAKNLSDRITARVHAQKPTGLVKNRSQFLAIQSDIRQAINDGWPIKVIWETLQDERKITFSYQTFTQYVNRYIKTSLVPSSSTPTTTLKSKNHSKSVKHQPKIISSTTEPTFTAKKVHGFTFDPNPKKEDLF